MELNPMIHCINRATGKHKKTFDTFDKAVAWANRMNHLPKFIHKQVAYKCKQCLKFHTGKSIHNTLLIHKENIFENKC